MSPNQILVRNMVLVVSVVAAVTTIALWLGRPEPARAAPLLDRQPTKVSPEELGADLYERKGCVACHSTDGSARVGPSFLHAFDSSITLEGGITIRVDEAYLRESLLAPRAKARPGYPPSMPEYEGLLREQEISALIAYVKSLR